MPAKAMSSLRWSSSRDSLGHQNNTKHNDDMKAVTSRLSHYDDDDDNNGVVIDDDYIGIDGVDRDDNVIDIGYITRSSSSSSQTHNKRHSAPIKVTITPTKTKINTWGKSKSATVQVNTVSKPPPQQRSASVSSPNQSPNRNKSTKKPGMVQLAVGIRIDSETLDQALHVAEVAARAGGSVLKQFSTATETTPASIVAIKVENAINDVLDQSDLGFDVHLRCLKEGSVWGEEKNKHPTDAEEEELSRAPTWLIKGLCGESDAHGAVSHDTVVSVGLAVGLVPAVGVVYDPFQEHVYTARIGEEAKINGKVITKHSKSLNVDDMVICTNISVPDAHEASDYREHCSGTLQNLMKAGIYKIKMLGSPARCIVDVAIGRACGYFECGPKASAVCAALVIAQCAQQVVTNIGENVQPPTISGALLNGNKDEHTCDVNARRFLCASSQEVKDKLMSCIAWPIPYMVRDDDHPFVEDTTDEFGSLQVYENVLSGGNNPNGGNVAGIPSKQRWSDRPVSKANEVVAPELKPILVPKSHSHMFESLKRQNSTPIIEVDESIPALKPPKSRREREIELHCAKEINSRRSYVEDYDNEALSWSRVAFTGLSKAQFAKTGWSSDDASATNARRRREMEIKIADDRASLVLDRALGLDTDTDNQLDTSVPIHLTAGGEEPDDDEFDNAAKHVAEVYQLQQSVRADQIKTILAKSLLLSNSGKWAASTTAQTSNHTTAHSGSGDGGNGGSGGSGGGGGGDGDDDSIFAGGDESTSLDIFQPHGDSVINDEDLQMTIDEWNEPPRQDLNHTRDLNVAADLSQLGDYLSIKGQDDDEYDDE